MTPTQETRSQFDRHVRGWLALDWYTVQDVAGIFHCPLIKARRSLERGIRDGLVRARRVAASKHASRGPRPLEYTVSATGKRSLL